jgi:hypothetical protein
MPQQLSAKEQSLFRTVVRNYEDKQYKKGMDRWYYLLADAYYIQESKLPTRSCEKTLSMEIHWL